jgi:hypothetical protein
MKKLLAVFVVFALVAGAAFAETTFSGSMGYKANLAYGDDSSETWSSANVTAAHLGIRFGGDNYGGEIRLHSFTTKEWWMAWGQSNSSGAPRAYAWWEPIQQIRFALGTYGDGQWGNQSIGGWGYNASAQDFVAIDVDTSDFDGAAWRVARTAGFYGGFPAVGAYLTVTPVNGFNINLGVPLATTSNVRYDGSDLTKELMKRFNVVVKYNIPDIGVANFVFVGAGGTDTTRANRDDWYRSTGTAYASFYLTAIQGIRADFGISYPMPYNADGTFRSADTGIGFGLRYTADAFDVKFRAGTTFGAKVVTGNKDVDKYGVGATAIGIGVLPSYNMGIMAIYFNMGLGWRIPNKDLIERDSAQIINDWFINPYIQVPIGGMNFWAGFKVGSNDTRWSNSTLTTPTTGVIKWAIPIGVSVGF